MLNILIYEYILFYLCKYLYTYIYGSLFWIRIKANCACVCLLTSSTTHKTNGREIGWSRHQKNSSLQFKKHRFKPHLQKRRLRCCCCFEYHHQTASFSRKSSMIVDWWRYTSFWVKKGPLLFAWVASCLIFPVTRGLVRCYRWARVWNSRSE